MLKMMRCTSIGRNKLKQLAYSVHTFHRYAFAESTRDNMLTKMYIAIKILQKYLYGYVILTTYKID